MHPAYTSGKARWQSKLLRELCENGAEEVFSCAAEHSEQQQQGKYAGYLQQQTCKNAGWFGVAVVQGSVAQQRLCSTSARKQSDGAVPQLTQVTRIVTSRAVTLYECTLLGNWKTLHILACVRLQTHSTSWQPHALYNAGRHAESVCMFHVRTSVVLATATTVTGCTATHKNSNKSNTGACMAALKADSSQMYLPVSL